ncbi:flavin reductase [Rhizobium sp. A37_96]
MQRSRRPEDIARSSFEPLSATSIVNLISKRAALYLPIEDETAHSFFKWRKTIVEARLWLEAQSWREAPVSLPVSSVAKVEINPVELRRTLGTFVTGVTVVTTIDQDGLPRGMTANSFTSVSLSPPLLLVCVNKAASSYEAFIRSNSFAINILHEGQVDVSNLFASKSPEKFQAIDFDSVHTGAPVLTDSLSWFDCKTFNRVDAGDHVVLIGEVLAFGASPAAPLAFCRGNYARIEQPMPSGWLPSSNMVVGYIVEWEGGILLHEDADGSLRLPTVKRRKPDRGLELSGGDELKVIAETTFLYSVFDVAEHGSGHLIFRASLATAPSPSSLPQRLVFYPADDLPFDKVQSNDVRAVLRRYQRERSDQRFGIYMDAGLGGRVAMLDTPAPGGS